jgi:hypothetical protein
MFCRRVLPLLNLSLLFCLHAAGQSVISARSGLVYFTEGAIFLDDLELPRSYGRFPEMKPGSVLRSEKGRAEVILAPGVFLRIDENSACRMISTSLKNSRLELQQGSAIFDSAADQSGSPATLIYKDWQIRLPKPGRYRVDSEPPQVRVYTGAAEVSLPGKTVIVNEARSFSFSAGFIPNGVAAKPDPLDRWAQERSKITSAAVAAAPAASSKKATGTRPYQSNPAPVPHRTW